MLSDVLDFLAGCIGWMLAVALDVLCWVLGEGIDE
jgi:hypothetical protein